MTKNPSLHFKKHIHKDSNNSFEKSSVFYLEKSSAYYLQEVYQNNILVIKYFGSAPLSRVSRETVNT